MTKPNQTTWNRELWTIVNASGDPWTHRVFESEAAAQKYLDEAKAKRGTGTIAHKVVPASITVRALRVPPK